MAAHLEHLVCDRPASGSPIRGGQSEADAALAAFDVSGYASQRNQVHPEPARGASRLSPYIRHGLLSLPEVWDGVEGPERDVAKFRDELLWQEYARHFYARLGPRTRSALRADPAVRSDSPKQSEDGAEWQSALACVSVNVDELTETGWLVNQARMWLASHWTVRHRRAWSDGEDYFFRHLLDGSRAANRLGWQWTTGAGSNKSYGFSRWQVEKRAPGLCETCPLSERCPIHSKPDEPIRNLVPKSTLLTRDGQLERTSGPSETVTMKYGEVATRSNRPDVVWITAESLGFSDAALVSNPDLPVAFIFDEPLLGRLRLSAKRLIFLVETLAELATERPIEVHLGGPVEILAGRVPAVTFAPVPGFRRLSAQMAETVIHPWPWLAAPHDGPIQSFSAWRRYTDR